MRILIYIHSLECGGAERVISLLSNKWCELGYKIKIITNTSYEKDFYEISNSIKRDFIDIKSKNKYLIVLERLIKLNKEIRDFRPDIALTFMTTANLYYLLSKLLVPDHIHVISERIIPNKGNISRLKNFLRIILYIFPSALVVQTKQIKSWYEKNTFARDIRIINNPIQINKNKKRNSLENNKFRLLFVGRLVYQKGIDLLINSFSDILKENKNIELKIIGEGPLYSNILEKIKTDPFLINKVILLGKKQDMTFYYENCDLLIIPSRFEGFPNVLLEGLNHNLNIISTKIIDEYEIFKDIDNIKFIEVNDSNELKNSIKKFYEKRFLNKEKNESLKKTLKRFEINRISNEWINLFKELRDESDIKKKS